jgi:hypothetical protein
MTQIAISCPDQTSNETWSLWIQSIEEWCFSHNIIAEYLYIRTDKNGSMCIWEISNDTHASMFSLRWDNVV